MKKKIFISVVIAAVVLLIGIGACLMLGQAKPAPLDRVVSYEVPEGWSTGTTEFWNDDGETVSEITYENGDGYLVVSIFSFRGRTHYGERANAREYAESLVDAERLEVDGRECWVGWRGMDDFERVNQAAYIFDGDYVVEVYLANSDDFVTKEQLRDLRKLLGSMRFGL